MEIKKYDVIVIGSGPGGEGASIMLAKSGKSVAIVERYTMVGGGATHWGTIPSKTIIHIIRQFAEFKKDLHLFKVSKDFKLSFPDLMEEVTRVVAKQVAERQGFYNRNNIDIINGNAVFVDPHTIAVTSDGVTISYQADAFILATGSRPYRPDDVDFTHHRIRDSDTILTMQEIPYSITVYGAGVVGCEYASAFRGLNSKVNLINTRDTLLSFLDDEISDALSYHLREQGVIIRNNEEYEQVEPLDDGVVLHLNTGKKIKSDYLLWANGRTGNSQEINLEQFGVITDQRGSFVVNDNYQTSLSHIYAVGDVIGYPSLASAAYDQGRLAATHIVEGHSTVRLIHDIPTGIYTTPEISSVGRTEEELTAARIPYEVGHAFFRNLARAQISGHTVGLLKILFHRETLELLGIHCFGYQASEIVHIGQAIMFQKGAGNTLKYFANTTFNYPTMAESYRVAALNGLNRLF